MTEQTATETRAPEKRWYVIHTYSGYENKVKANLEHRIESMGMEDKIFQVLVPMEDEIEIRQGQRHTVQKKVYPGYVLVEMILDPDSWFVVRNTPGVTSFVGGSNIPGVRSEPFPLDETERFTIAIDPTATGGVLKMTWDTTQASVPFTVK